MRFRLAISVAIGTVIVAALTTGCPGSEPGNAAKAEAGKPTSQVENAGTSGNATPATDAKTAVTADSTAAAQAASDSLNGEVAAATDPLVFPERTDDPSLEGKWFALFGHHDLGLVKHSWVDGHNVEFRQNGQAFWYRVVNGAEVDTMDSQWSMEGNGQLKLSFSAARAVESGLSKLAPMGIAPLGTGGTEEIGLAGGSLAGGNASAMVLLDAVMDIQLDHNYLVIRDSYSRLMVYGRESGESLEVPGGIDGEWVGKGTGDRRYEAQFELKGEKLGAVMNHRTTEFSGVFAQGYFVGEMLSPKGLELVAFYYDELGFLDGVRYTKPFRVVTMEYEFVKSPDPV